MGDSYKKLVDFILNEPHTHVHGHINATCVKCHKVELHMVRIGAVIFCEKCFCEVFKTEHPFEEEKGTYKYWLDIYMKQPQQ